MLNSILIGAGLVLAGMVLELVVGPLRRVFGKNN